MIVLETFGQIALITSCALALCVYVGWGAARLALPAALRPSGALFVPLVGYAMTIWVGYIGVSTVLNLRWSLALLIGLATLLNGLAWRSGARPQPGGALRADPAVWVLLVVTLLVGVLPLLRYGYLTAIGQGWDTESYLPLAQHLCDYPLARIAEAPISPLRDLVRDPPRIGVTLGFPVFQGMTMLLSRQSALATFAPLLALLRALGVLAVYAWLRGTMGLGRPAALLGAALTSAGALLLWVTFFNFGMQLAAWPLLALGLALGLAALEELACPETMNDERKTKTSAHPSLFIAHRASLHAKLVNLGRPGTALLAAVALAALPVAYYPALTIWVPLAAGLGIARCIEAARHAAGEPGPVRLLGAALALGALALLLAAPTIQDYFEGFSFRYSLPAPHIGPDRFIAATDTLGLTTFRLPGGGPQPPAALVALGAIVALALAVAAWALPPATMNAAPLLRLRWAGVAGAALAYLAWLRFGRPYEYAYMKGSAYAGFVAWGLVAFGWQTIRSRITSRMRAITVGLGLLLLLVTGWAQALTIGDHWAGPAIFTRDIAAFDAAASLVPPGTTVAITSDARLAGPNSGLFSALLYGRAIWGHLVTAYTRHAYWPEGGTPQYALLAADERPWPLDIGGQELWRSRAAALYRIDPQQHVLWGRAAFYSPAPPSDAGAPAALALWRRGGPYRVASRMAPLTLLIGDTLRFGPGRAQGAPRDQQVRLTVATLAPQTITLSIGERQERTPLAAGVSHIDLSLTTPTALTIASDEPLALISAVARPSAAVPDALARLDTAQVAWTVQVDQRGPTMRVRLELANPGRHALRLGLTVIEDTFTRPHRAMQVLAPAPIDDPWQLDIDLLRGTAQALVGTTPTPLLDLDAAPNPPDGTYIAMLTLYAGAEAVASEPLFTVRIAGGQVAALDATPFTIEATPIGPAHPPLPATDRALLADEQRLDGGAVTLEAALLRRQPPWPGADRAAPLPPADPFTVQLWWRADQPPAQLVMVSLQVLGADDHKWAQWDGPLGGDWRPVHTWRSGDRVRQDVPLTLDRATPPGTYRLILIVYDPATGQPDTFNGQRALELGELIVR